MYVVLDEVCVNVKQTLHMHKIAMQEPLLTRRWLRRSPRLLKIKSFVLRWSGCRARPIKSMERIRFCFTTVSWKNKWTKYYMHAAKMPNLVCQMQAQQRFNPRHACTVRVQYLVRSSNLIYMYCIAQSAYACTYICMHIYIYICTAPLRQWY